MKRVALLFAVALAGCSPDCSEEKCREVGGTPMFQCEREWQCDNAGRNCDWRQYCTGAIRSCARPAEAPAP